MSGDPCASRAREPLFHHPEARALARRFAGRFELIERPLPPVDRPGFHLWAVDDHLELRRARDRQGVWVDLAELSRRAADGSELLRACTAGGTRRRVLDPMAGWGVDGLVLARRGHDVTLVEGHPMLEALLEDLVRRSGANVRRDGGAEVRRSGAEVRRDGGADVVCRCGDGFAALAEPPGYDVIYLDPMFPPRRKHALPGKRLQWTAALTSPDERPLSAWLDAARTHARERVVVKRRRRDPAVAPADWQITGRTVRYDVYRGMRGA